MHGKNNKIINLYHFLKTTVPMLNNILRAGAVSRYGSGSEQMMQLWLRLRNTAIKSPWLTK
jgi:hypothetical protein